MGLLDNPQDAAMLQLGLGLLSAGGPSRSPVSLGQAIGSAGQGAMEEYRRTQQMQQQMAQRKMQEQMQQVQLSQHQMTLDESTRRNAALKQFRDQLPAELQGRFDVDPQGFLKAMSKDQEEYTLTPGAARFKGDKQIAAVPSAEKSAPTPIQEYQFAVGQGYKGSYDQWDRSRRQAGAISIQNYPAPMAAMNPATGQTELVQFGNKGDVKPTGFKPALDAKPPTESEAKAALYASNMKAASNVISKLEGEGMNMASLGNQADTMLAGGITNLVASPRAQKARQAQEQWAESMLRMMTGAAATKDEITRNVKTYFPSAGDGPDVVAQKRAMRAQAESGVFAASGRAQGRVQDAPKQERTVVRRGKYNGKTVVQYSDGSIENAD